MSDVRLITSDKLSRYSLVRFAMSTRVGGVSLESLGMNLSFGVDDNPANVVENRKRFFGSLGFSESECAIPHQCHSANVQIVSNPGEYEACDGLITKVVGLPLVVTVADCVPIVLYDPAKSVLGLVHAGWRGAAQGIVAEAVNLMVKRSGAGADEMIAYVGPAAGVCCYQVGRRVGEVFSQDQVEQHENHLYLNLKKANCDQLLSTGVREEYVEISPCCTICTPQLFHSHRRDKNRSGRMMAAVSLVQDAGS